MIRITFFFVAILIALLGLRMIGVAIRTAISGKVLVRHGFRTDWQPASSRYDALKIAFRDGLMGILLVLLGVVIIF